MTEYFIIGEIVNTHGIKGELKIMPETDDPSRFKKLKTVRVVQKSVVKEYKVSRVRFFKQFVIIALEGIDTMDKAATLKGALMEVPRSEAIKLPEDTYFIADLIGCRVYETNNNLLGEVTDVIQTGSNDVYDVKNDDGRSILIPVLKSVVLDVDVVSGKIVVELLPGLREIYEN